MDQEFKRYDVKGTQVEIEDWQNESNAVATEQVGQQVAEERELKTRRIFSLLIILYATRTILITMQWLLLPLQLSVHFVLLATAATNAAPRPDPSSESIMSNSLSDLTSLCIVSRMYESNLGW